LDILKGFNNHTKTFKRAIGVNLSIFLQRAAERAEFHGEKIKNNFNNLLREIPFATRL